MTQTVTAALDDIPANPIGPLMSDIIAEARSFLDEMDAGRLEDTSVTTDFTLLKAAQQAYVEYSKRTRCYRTNTTLTFTTTISGAIYPYTSFLASGRLFDVDYVSYDGDPLEIRSQDFMDANYPTWREDGNATPRVAIPWGEKYIRLWYPPDAAKTLRAEGYLSADLSTFAAVTDRANVPTSRQTTLAAGTAVMAGIRLLGIPEVAMQQQECSNIWEAGIKTATQEIHGSTIEIVGSSRRRPVYYGTDAAITG